MSKPQVVITRKDKRIRHKLLHAVAFAATGGASGIVTAAEVVNNAAYNARTAQLAADPQPRRRGRKVKFTPEELEYLRAHTARQ